MTSSRDTARSDSDDLHDWRIVPRIGLERVPTSCWTECSSEYVPAAINSRRPIPKQQQQIQHQHPSQSQSQMQFKSKPSSRTTARDDGIHQYRSERDNNVDMLSLQVADIQTVVEPEPCNCDKDYFFVENCFGNANNGRGLSQHPPPPPSQQEKMISKTVQSSRISLFSCHSSN